MSLEQLSRNSHCPKCGHYFARQKETHKDLARQVCAKRDFRVLDIIASGIKRMCHISAQFDPPLGKTQTQRSIWRLVTAGYVIRTGAKGTLLECTANGLDVSRTAIARAA